MEVSTEIHFAQTLAANEKKIRDRALKRLRKYIGVRSNNGVGMSHDDYIKIWKGLHYCMWMQDKPLIQEELSQKMTDLLHAFPQLKQALEFVNVFFITEAREWIGIDKFRLDKFMMLMRDVLREAFVLLSREGWPLSECRMFAQHLVANVTNEDKSKIPYGVKMHLAEIFLVELRKVPLDGMNGKKLTCLMFPFIYFLLKTKRRELAKTMYEKTLLTAFKWFGNWPWQSEKKKGEPKKNLKKKLIVADDEEEEESDDEEMESEDEEIDDFSDSDEEDMELQEEEDDDGEKNKHHKHKFDLRILLRLLLRLAKDPAVESRNRTYVYGIVNSFTTRHSNLLESDAGDNENDEIDVTSVYQLTGEPVCNASRKKRQKKKRQQFEKEAALEMNNEVKSLEKKETSTDCQKPSKKKIQMEKESNKNCNGIENKLVVELPAKTKKRKRSSIDGSSSAKKIKTSVESLTVDEVTENKVLSPKASEKKKRKSLTDDDKASTHAPLQEKDDNSCDGIKNKKTSPTTPSGLGKKNKRSSLKLDNVSQVVTPGNQNGPQLSATNSTTASTESPKKTSPGSGLSPKSSKKRSKLQSTPTLMEDAQTAVSIPSSEINGAMGMSTPSASKDKTGATAVQLTPASQKKVIFDLKRNSANKFKDYLMTLANVPSPAYEPSKIPGQSILKSPAARSLNSTPVNTKRKARRGSKSPKSPLTMR